jgi:ankyrin repeat protein
MIATMYHQRNVHYRVILTELLKRGADVNLADAKGRTALMMAAANNDIDAFSKLMRRGASADMVIAALDLVRRDRRELFETWARKVRLNPQPSDGSEDGDSD